MQDQHILDSTYRIIREYSSGGGGVVYLAYHTRLEKNVIVKKIKSEVKDKLHIRAEADLLKNLHHTYLPQVYDFIIENGEIYTVMEFIEGETLQKKLEAGVKFRQSDIVKYGTQLAEVVKYLHSRKPAIIHRDIAPDNIIITPNGDICLIDFNVSFSADEEKGPRAHKDGYSPPELYVRAAKKPAASKAAAPVKGSTVMDVPSAADKTVIDEGTIIDKTVMDDKTVIDSGTIIDRTIVDDKTVIDDGTIIDQLAADDKTVIDTAPIAPAPAKMTTQIPPAAGRLSVDERADIYSIGASLYALAVGEPPKRATEAQSSIPEKAAESLGDALVKIINKCIQLEKSKRYSSAEALHKAFVNIRKIDSRYRRLRRRYTVASCLTAIVLAVSGVTAVQGYRTMQVERQDAYESLILQANEARTAGLLEEALAFCDEAERLYPEKIAVERIRALVDFDLGNYAEGLTRVLDRANRGVSDGEEYRDFADLLYCGGLCAFNDDRLDTAVELLGEALTYNRDNTEYYCDYAIALARSGKDDAAREMLAMAIQIQGSEDDPRIYLVKGEIGYLDKNIEEATVNMKRVLETSTIPYNRYRAYMLCADICAESGARDRLTDGVAMVEEALEEFRDKGYLYSLLLAHADLSAQAARSDAAISDTYYAKAAASYEQLIRENRADYTLYLNAALVESERGSLSVSDMYLDTLMQQYPDNYRAYKLRALFIADYQNSLLVAKRDYSEVYEYYTKAAEAYEKECQRVSGFFDPEMQMLEQLIDDLKANGWLDN